MGCLNSEGQFSHWFGNIHFSGPCNRSCYFCIGQYMQSLESLNNLSKWPLDSLDTLIQECEKREVKEINLTGTNTDPFLYEHIPELRKRLSAFKLGVRTNGALILSRPDLWTLFDKASISIHSFNSDTYKKIMGQGEPPDLKSIVLLDPFKPIKINVVLCPENISSIPSILSEISECGIKQVNLREPYGQPHLGNPLLDPIQRVRYGMPVYEIFGMEVMYWDVHYVEVESVNLYANGNVSTTYPITKGYAPEGKVLGQDHWTKSGRHFQQWQSPPPAA